jgi:hypothetical protein
LQKAIGLFEQTFIPGQRARNSSSFEIGLFLLNKKSQEMGVTTLITYKKLKEKKL